MHAMYRVVLRNPEDDSYVSRITHDEESAPSLTMAASIRNAIVFRHTDWQDFMDVNRLPLSLRTQIQALQVVPVDIVAIDFPRTLVN